MVLYDEMPGFIPVATKGGTIRVPDSLAVIFGLYNIASDNSGTNE